MSSDILGLGPMSVVAQPVSRGIGPMTQVKARPYRQRAVVCAARGSGPLRPLHNLLLFCRHSLLPMGITSFLFEHGSAGDQYG
jgi:hypothetical protein